MEISLIENRVAELLPKAGVNKKREIVRLVFEISAQRALPLEQILPYRKGADFEKIKKELLKMRYPVNYGKASLSSFYLPKLEPQVYKAADYGVKEFYPNEIYVDQSSKNTELAARVKNLFPAASYSVVPDKTVVGSKDYSDRYKTLYIINEKFDFVKPCPCTGGAAGCGYNLVNLGFGCSYECAYCFLQEYQNMHAVLMPSNIKDFLSKIDGAKFTKGPFDKVRIGSGEFTDSLVFDHITQYSKDIISFFATRPEMYFEFKTKSVNIDGVLAQKAVPNIVVGWSVNAENIIDNAEYLTPSLGERLKAARKVADAGFSTALHFDPVIIHENWRANYTAAVRKMADMLEPEKVLWISVGTLRFNRELKKVIEARHARTDILNGELLLGYDGKMRYSDAQRKEVYAFMLPLLEKYFPKSKIYLCMESPGMHRCL
ncbi:spore photoproduct lyase [Elusimicrobium posterum]|uniref:SPL family radical SAM protein n=1 Tax=Elusimicrobium posterum TaxID=3116653 RepID=UPI003C762775